MGHRIVDNLKIYTVKAYSDAFWQQYQHMLGNTQSLRDFKDTQYFGLIRNYLRHNWLMAYLFGASPAVCECFMKEPHVDLKPFDEHTLYGPYATSLRLSDIGYQNDAQSHLHISYNDLTGYVSDLTYAIKTPEIRYQKMGVIKNGQYLQLNDHILQIEAEFYGSIRPKRVSKNNQRPSKALLQKGVEYIEVRSLDINPFEPNGIALTDILFLDIFLLYCLLSASPPLAKNDQQQIRDNLRTTVLYGRKPGIDLLQQNQKISLQQWAGDIMKDLKPIARLLDQQQGGEQYQNALSVQADKVGNPQLLASAKIVTGMEQYENRCYLQFAMNIAHKNKHYFTTYPLPDKIQTELNQLAVETLAKQYTLEQQSEPSFEQYLADYFC